MSSENLIHLYAYILIHLVYKRGTKMNKKEVQKIRFNLIIALLADDENLQRKLKAYMGWK